MRNFVIWPVVLLAMAKTAFSETQGSLELAVDLGGGVKMEMVRISAGSFLTSDDKSAADREKHVHKVNITKPFCLGKYEVTQEQWEAVMGNNPSAFKGPKNPVEQVSWNDCRTFFDKLNEKTGEQGSEFVLPTEAQWEYACRAGSTSKFCFGDDENQLGEYAWYGKNSGGEAHPVGKKKPNAFGLYDMCGNVWEWCADYWTDYYAKSPADDPRGPTTGSKRVNRGGGWRHDARSCRSAVRSSSLGFRVALVYRRNPRPQ